MYTFAFFTQGTHKTNHLNVFFFLLVGLFAFVSLFEQSWFFFSVSSFFFSLRCFCIIRNVIGRQMIINPSLRLVTHNTTNSVTSMPMPRSRATAIGMRNREKTQPSQGRTSDHPADAPGLSIISYAEVASEQLSMRKKPEMNHQSYNQFLDRKDKRNQNLTQKNSKMKNPQIFQTTVKV